MAHLLTGPDQGGMDEDQLAAAYPWPEGRRWVRAMMVMTLDGAAAGPDGLSGSISSGADQEVFLAVRRLADVVLVGAGTIRAERYQPMLARPADHELRSAAGQAVAPVIAVVSGSLDLPWQEPMWADSAVRPLVLTRQDAKATRLAKAREHADVIALPSLDVATMLTALAERGLRRIVCEGGPRLLAAVVDAGLLDEADITMAPLFAGGEYTLRAPALPELRRFHLAHVIAGDGYLMNRYLVHDGPVDS